MRRLSTPSYALSALFILIACASEYSDPPGSGLDDDDGVGARSGAAAGGAKSPGGTPASGAAGKSSPGDTGGRASPPSGQGGSQPSPSAGSGGRTAGSGGTGNTSGSTQFGGTPSTGVAGSGGSGFGMAGTPGKGGSGFGMAGAVTGSAGRTFGQGGVAGSGIAGRGGSGNAGAPTGNAGKGGTMGSGGAPSGNAGSPPAECTGQEQVCNNRIDEHCGYTFEYWKDNGTGCMTNKTDGFSVEWSNINNLLARKGVRPGTQNNVVTYEANYQPNGNSYLTVYGWSRDPLVEYYIVESWGTYRPPGGMGFMGTVNSDGGTYDIYRTQRVNQNSIDGVATFYQFWSVRQQKRTSGTVTVANHFQAWAGKGMNLGALYEVSMTVEGYQSSGKADVKMSVR